MRRVELTTVIAAASAGFAAWLSIGSLAVADASASSRFGFLPPFWLLPCLILTFTAAAWAFRLSTARSLPLFFSLVLALPWLPCPVPAVFLLWTGPLIAGVWMTVALGMAFVRTTWRPPASPLLPAAIAFAAYLAGAWWLDAVLPGGDGPHYLVITQSILRDGDLRVENNYTEQHYRAYIGGTLRPHYLQRSIHGEIYSVHAPGLPAVVAPAFALFGYPGVVGMLALVAAGGSALLWRAAYLLTSDASAAWFAWAAGALSVPFFFESFAVFPDGLGATIVLFAALPLFEEHVSTKRWVAVGALLGLLPWLHTRFAVISAMLVLVIVARLLGSAENRSRIAPFLSVPMVAALAWFGFFKIVYGTFNPAAPYGDDTQTSAANILNGLPALWLDQQFGVLPNAPVYVFCLAGLVVLARRRTRLALEISAVALPYLLAVSAFHMWWGGASAPARFLAPILPLLAVPAAWLWSATPRSSTRAVGLALLAMSLAATAVLAVPPEWLLAYNQRDGYARAAEWINPLVDVPLALPSFFRSTPGPAVLRAAVWLGCLWAAAVALRLVERKIRRPGALALATPLCFAAAITCAMTTVWAIDNVGPLKSDTSQMNLLADYNTRVRPVGVHHELGIVDATLLLPHIVVTTPTRRETPPASTLLLAPAIVPGGEYELRLAASSTSASGHARLVIGRVARPNLEWDLATDLPDGRVTFSLPVTVGSLVVVGDMRGAEALTLHPMRIWEGSSRLTHDIARRVERYGRTRVFFLDGNSFPETSGFWVKGGRRAQVAAAPDDRIVPLQLFVRNAAAVNQVRVEFDGQAQTLDLRPSEERLLEIPIAAERPGALIDIRSSSGFHPSDVEPDSTDTRYLGVWIEFR